jgi:predicted unusual protein kinase regulating ubiquinone biosynthesis (AarF/ABC1/UbiB family)
MRRARRTGTAVAKIYLGYKGLELIDRGVLRGVVRAGRRRWHRASARTLSQTALEMGGLLLKAGQYLSTRSDVLPPAYIEPLARLQDRAPPHPYRVVRRVIREELGADPDEIFARFWRRPVASASLAQVHRAELPDGRDVAVKVQRPEIAAAVSADLQNLRMAVQTIERLEGTLGLGLLLDELESSVPRELDFLLEAQSAIAMAERFAGDQRVRIPAVVEELSRPRVLVTEFVSGIKITDIRRLRRAEVDPTQVARTLMDSYARQVLVHGVFHGDPHPGNLIVTPNDEVDFHLHFVDFGLVQELPPDFQQNVRDLAMRLVDGDAFGVARALEQLGLETADPDADTIVLASELLVEFVRRKRASGEPVRTRDIGEELVAILRADPLVRMPPHLWLIGRVLGLLRGVSASLGAPRDLVSTLLPYLLMPNP